MSKPLRILVVDDDRDHADSLAELFEIEGHSVETAYNGEGAIAAFTRSEFDIAFMDVMMPNMNGVESFFEIRRQKPDAKVIMMTGYSVDQLLKQATKNGAIGVLQKPLSPQSVIETLDAIAPGGVALVSDDNDNLGTELTQIIADEGKSCSRIEDKKQINIHLGQTTVDALVLDFDAPLIDYLGAHSVLQTLGTSLPTIFITDYAEKFADGSASGIDSTELGILSKPYEPEALILKLHDLAG